MTTTQENSFDIPAAVLWLAQNKLEKLNKRARKLGQSVVTISVSPCYCVRSSKEQSLAYKNSEGNWVIDMVTVTVHGDAPVIDGFKFIAVVDCRGENPIIRRTPGAPDVDLSEFYNTKGGRCDHCHTNRFRNDVLILMDESTGDLIQIGRNCAADFFRTKNAAKIIQLFSYFSGMADEDYRFDNTPRAELYIRVIRVLEMAAAVVRTHGFCSVKQAEWNDGQVSTKMRVYENLFCRHHLKGDDLVDVVAEDQQIAAEVYQWLNDDFVNKAADTRTEFENNVAGAVEFGNMIRERNIGYIAWMINGLQKKKARENAAAHAAAARAASEWVGEVGKRETFTAKLIGTTQIDGYYGVTTIFRFKDENNNTIVWFASNGMTKPINNTYTFDATVKKHDEFKDEKQTVVSRLKFKE